MTLEELCEYNEKAQAEQDKLSIADQILLLKKHKKSVFVFYMNDGSKKVRGDSETGKRGMKKFFKEYPQTGVRKIKFFK